MLSQKYKDRNETAIQTLVPEMQPIARKHIEMSSAANVDLVITFGFRSVAQQNDIWAQGHTKPGKIVTNAKGGYSWHNFARAYDVAVVTADGKEFDWKYDSDEDHDGTSDYKEIIDIARKLGLGCGADFKNLFDFGHFEYHPGLTLEQARAKAGIV